MSLSEQEAQVLSLSDRRVWIIDDDIPVLEAPFLDDATKQGLRPIDRGTLLHLLSVAEWEDDALRSLCSEIVHDAGEVAAFLHPESALAHLQTGVPAPDVVVFDWEYQIGP